MRDHRLIDDLSKHEIQELDEDFDIDVRQKDAYVLAVITEDEWKRKLLKEETGRK